MAVTLTIDGRSVEVSPGATVLDAARQLGIEIPTLCHADGVPPAGSCFLCVVRVEGRPNLVPSCVAPAEDRMVVTTCSDEIRAARKAALELLLSDHVGDCVAPCTRACPAGMDIPGMIRRIRQGDRRQALAVVKERVPFAGALGRICARYCERVCRRGELDEPIAVCALKRFAADAALEAGSSDLPPLKEPTGRKVAIVGAGPAGLSAAFYLLQDGHACTVFDANPAPGGMFRYAVSEFRLPKRALEAEIDIVRRLGAEFCMNQCLGDNLDIGRLRREHDAVLLAVGAAAAGALSCQGADLAQPALAFLRDVSEGRKPIMPDAVVVLGGGNEAVAAAQMALRLGALRVTLACETARQSMPCFSEWVDAVIAEGVKLEPDVEPRKIEQSGRGQFSVILQRAGQTVGIEAGLVIAAPVRRVDLALFKGLGLSVTGRGIAVDRHTLATTLEGVFAAGEAVTGPGAGVRAVAAARLAALCISQFLSGGPVRGEARAIQVLMSKLSEAEHGSLFRRVATGSRAQQPTLDPEQRWTALAEVTSGFSEGEAAREARRCIQCDCLAKDTCRLRQYATEYGAEVGKCRGDRRAFNRDASHPEVVYESGKCILCGLCVRILEQAGVRPGITFAGRGFSTRLAVPFGKSVADGLGEMGARCAAACPTGALARKRPSEKPAG
jgi:NADPH-dependent glutamate synthase beta subunit-like oxidoreductase/ferredoxin